MIFPSLIIAAMSRRLSELILKSQLVQRHRRQTLAVKTAFLLMLLPAGCSPRPKMPDSLQDKVNEAAFVQAKVDLLIAKADLEAIENDQYRLDGAHKGWEQANRAKDLVNSDRLFKEMDEFGKDMDKDIDRAAHHRCDR
jgi:hypothetical protein